MQVLINDLSWVNIFLLALKWGSAILVAYAVILLPVAILKRLMDR
jgi:hypothetical protein